jgi:hypothetical protein
MIAQTDYNKADEKEKKMGFGRFYPESKTKVWEL